MSDVFPNLDDFNRELDKFMENIPEQAVIIQRKIALELLRRIVLLTPVDTGRARGGWQTTINNSPEQEVRSEDPIMEGAKALADIPPNSVVYLTNNVHYIVYLEEGSSQQAPHGMVKIALEELRAMFQ